MILLVNLETGEEYHADEDQLQEFGLPDGFSILEQVRKEELWNLLSEFLRDREDGITKVRDRHE